MITEKESRALEMLKIMGVSLGTLWSFSYMYVCVYGGLLSLICAGVMLGQVFVGSYGIMFFLFFFLMIGMVSFAILTSSLTSKARLGSFLATLAFYFWSVPATILIAYADVPLPVTRFFMVLFPTAFAMGAQEVYMMGLSGYPDDAGLIWKHLTTSYKGMTILEIYGWQLFDATWMFVIGWYMYNVFPGTYGIGKPWYFFVTRNYWMGKRHKVESSFSDSEEGTPQSDSTMIQCLPRKSKKVVEVKSLKKTFKSRNLMFKRCDVAAVNGVSLEICEGEIFALLGHNGAGKTTMISMMIGLLNATSGTTTVDGYDIQTETDMARERIGFCPQYDIVYTNLTVYEHLNLYSMLRCDGSYSDRMEEINDILNLLELQERKDNNCRDLSGGQKRRLSIGIALVGSAKAVFLDEPASGLDPFTRRALWETLKRMRGRRAILMTTHMMEEAEFLGDRIGIMAGGTMQCLGTLPFLRGQFGVGYTMIFNKLPKCSGHNVDALEEFLLTNLPGSSLIYSIALEISFKIPFSAAVHMPDVLTTLEDQLVDLFSMSSYSIGITTLEEVFLRVGRHAEIDLDQLTAEERLLTQQRGAHNAAGDVSTKAPVVSGGVSSDEYSEQVSSSDAINESVTQSSVADTKTIGTKTIATNDSEYAYTSDVFTQSARHKVPPTKSNKALYQFRSQIIRRFQAQSRDMISFVCIVIIPSVLVIVSMFVAKHALSTGNSPVALDYSPLESYVFRNALIPQPMPIAGRNTTVFQNCDGLFDKIFVDAATAATKDAMDEYLLATTLQQPVSRYTGFFVEDPDPTIPSQFPATIVYHNSSYTHALPTAVNTYAQCRLNETLPNAKLTLRNQPLNRVKPIVKALTEQGTALYVALSLSVTMSTWASVAARERCIGAQSSQYIAGLSSFWFLFSSVLWNWITFTLPFFITWIVVEAFQNVLVQGGRRAGFLLGMLFFGFAAAPYAQMLSTFFSNPLLAQVCSLLMATILPVVGAVLQSIESTKNIWNNGLAYVFYFIIPTVTLDDLFIDLTSPFSTDPWGADYWTPAGFLIGTGFLYFTIAILIDYYQTNTKWQTNVERWRNKTDCCHRRNTAADDEENEAYRTLKDEDENVVEERERLKGVLKSGNTYDKAAIRVLGVRKTYKGRKNCCSRQPDVAAVKGVWFEVQKGQCFGFLGVNGAGKSTTLNMITGAVAPDGGDVVVAGEHVAHNPRKLWPHIGYCPQHDTHYDFLTGREHLMLYCRLRLINENKLSEVCDQIINLLGIKEYADRQVGTYSGGNKRKLSVGLAFIGSPSVVFLDEPSTGVDPASRRKLWNVITHTTSVSDRAVVLTTHSMEECEALCDRLGIMKAGSFACLGTSSWLKNRYGQGYQIDITFKADVDSVPNEIQPEAISKKLSRVLSRRQSSKTIDVGTATSTAKDALLQAFPGATLVEVVGFHQRWSIPKSSGDNTTRVTTATLFSFMEQHKDTLGVDSYAVSDATLESIFVAFCKTDDVPED
eukprot:Lankesteria_metandrocarpae@DN5469_c0_g1_i2.p1